MLCDCERYGRTEILLPECLVIVNILDDLKTFVVLN